MPRAVPEGRLAARRRRSAASTAARRHARAFTGATRTTTSSTRERSSRVVHSCPASYARHQALERRSAERWERQPVRANAAAATSRPTRGWAGENSSPATRWRRARRGGDRALRPVAVLRSSRLPGRARILERMRNRIDRPVGTIVYTQLPNARGGARPISVTRARGSLPARHRTAFGTQRPRVAGARRVTARCTERRNSAPRASASGGRSARCARPSVHAVARDLGRRHPGDRVAGHARRNASGSTARRSGLRLWDTLHVDGDGRRLSRDRRAGAREGLPRPASDLNSETTPYEAGLGFAVKRDKGEVGRDALDGRACAGSCASCSRIRGRRVGIGSGVLRMGDRRPGDERRLGYAWSARASPSHTRRVSRPSQAQAGGRHLR
jgi:4-methylaminobutanoate oxidase (formaldehyde-forming)